MITENHISVLKTARYYTYGQLNSETTNIWIVCHGYGQLAKDMLPYFEGFDPKKNYVVAPEALSRFYWNGFSTKAVASWMTSEDRICEIRDYINYLDHLYQYILKQCVLVYTAPNIHVIGFSQGATTVSRWIGEGRAQPDYLSLWAGQLAHDLDWEKTTEKFKQLKKLFIVYGNQDKFVTKDNVLKQEALLNTYDIESEIIAFDGKHSLKTVVLKELADNCMYL